MGAATRVMVRRCQVPPDVGSRRLDATYVDFLHTIGGRNQVTYLIENVGFLHESEPSSRSDLDARLRRGHDGSKQKRTC
jgi:hypothetical protein